MANGLLVARVDDIETGTEFKIGAKVTSFETETVHSGDSALSRFATLIPA